MKKAKNLLHFLNIRRSVNDNDLQNKELLKFSVEQYHFGSM